MTGVGSGTLLESANQDVSTNSDQGTLEVQRQSFGDSLIFRGAPSRLYCYGVKRAVRRTADEVARRATHTGNDQKQGRSSLTTEH